MKFIKKNAGPNQSGPKYRTPDHFKGSLFGGKKPATPKFNPAQFKIQHRG